MKSPAHYGLIVLLLATLSLPAAAGAQGRGGGRGGGGGDGGRGGRSAGSFHGPAGGRSSGGRVAIDRGGDRGHYRDYGGDRHRGDGGRHHGHDGGRHDHHWRYRPGWSGGAYFGPGWGWDPFYSYGYPYPYAYYAPYGSYGYYRSPIFEAPVLYVQKSLQPSEVEYWYYCTSSNAYYPNVSDCSEEWIKVPPRAEAPE